MEIMIDIPKDLYEKIESHNVLLSDIDVICQSILDGDIYQEQLDADHDCSRVTDCDRMREPTDEEREAVQVYIDSISVDTGINFFDLIKGQEIKMTRFSNFTDEELDAMESNEGFGYLVEEIRRERRFRENR